MESSPLVSVIIPTNKRPKLLKRAVESVKRQTYKNVEIIVVDDANDVEVRKLFENDVSVKLLVNPTNKGACYSRNKGLKDAAGEIINFLDDDDELNHDKIEKQIKQWFESGFDNYGMFTCHADDCRSGKSVIRYNCFKGNIYKKLLVKCVVNGTETVLYKKSELEKIQGFDENLISNHEYDLLIRYSKNNLINFVDEVLSKRHQSHDQISVNTEKKIIGLDQLYQKHQDRFKSISIFFGIWMSIRYKLMHFKFRLKGIVNRIA